MNKGRKRLLKVVSVIMTCMICVNFCCISSYAYSVSFSWSLTRTNGPRQEWADNRLYAFDANSNYISILRSTKQNSAVVGAKMRDPFVKSKVVYIIDGNLSTGGSALSTHGATKGANYEMKVYYEKIGTAPNTVKGSITH